MSAERGPSPHVSSALSPGRLLPAAVAGLIGSLACVPPTPGGPALVLEPLASPAAASSSAPQLMSDGTRAVLSWLEDAESGTSLRFAERTDEGWSAPRAVVTSREIVTNAADVPSLYLMGESLVAQWIERLGPKPAASSLMLAFSEDHGRTWSPPVRPHHDDTPTQHGFASLFRMKDGGLGLVWLDGRTTDPEKPEGEGGDMALWAATYDRERRQTSEQAIDDRACDCCQTSAVATDRAVIVTYRDRSPEEVRDIVVVRLEGGRWTAPTAVHDDGWTIHGCPVNGPAVDASRDEVVVAWFTGSTGQGRVLASFSQDGGRSFSPPVRVDDGFPRGRVDVALTGDGAAVVSWVETAAGRPALKARPVVRDHMEPAESVTIAAVAGSDYPRMARRGEELLFAWVAREDGGRLVRTARASIP